MIKCLSCGFNAAILTPTGLHCNKCNHDWTFQEEAETAVYIKTVLRRVPILGIESAPTETAVMRMDDLSIVDGIGAKTKQRLNAAGFSTFYALSNARVDELLEIVPNITEETALDWISRAGQLAITRELPAPPVKDKETGE